MTIDPVCNMEVSERDAPGKAEYNGKEYFFCSKQCETKFNDNPQQYSSNAA